MKLKVNHGGYMGYQKTMRYINYFRNKGLGAQKIADELNMAGERQPKTKALFDARSVERLMFRHE